MIDAALLEKYDRPNMDAFARLPISEKLQTTFALHQAALCAQERVQKVAGRVSGFGKRAVVSVMTDWAVLGHRLCQTGGAVFAALLDTRNVLEARNGDAVAERCFPILHEMEDKSAEIERSGFATHLVAKEKIEETNILIPAHDTMGRAVTAGLVGLLCCEMFALAHMLCPNEVTARSLSFSPLLAGSVAATAVLFYPYKGILAYRALEMGLAKVRRQGPFVKEMHKRLDGMEKTGKFEVLPYKMRRGLVLGA